MARVCYLQKSEPAGDHCRAIFSMDLDCIGRNEQVTVRASLLQVGKDDAGADSCPNFNWGNPPDTIKTVVERILDIGRKEVCLMTEKGQQGQREKTLRDCLAYRPSCGPRDVHVHPVGIVSYFGEPCYALLSDEQPIGDRDLLSDVRLHFFE